MSKKRRVRLTICAVYALYNTATEEMYVGGSRDVRKRGMAHFSALRRGVHSSIKLQQSFDTHGEENFRLLVLDQCDSPTMLHEKEDFFIHKTPRHLLLNTAMSYHSIHDPAVRRRMTEAARTPSARLKMSQARRRRKCTDATREKLAQARLGIKCTDVTKLKMSKASLGRKHTDVTKLKISKATLGRKPTDATRLKMSQARRGRKLSDATKEKLRQAALGRKPTAAARVKMSLWQKGIPKSKEYIAKRTATKRANKLALQT